MAKILKKSDAKKELSGTLESSRQRKPKLPTSTTNTSVRLPPTFAEPPKYLDKEGQEIFYDLARHVQSVKQLWGIDTYIIGQAAYWIRLYSRTIAEANDEYIQTFATGAKQISPQFSIIDKSEQHIRKYFEMLGIGPKSRESIGAFNDSQGEESGGDAFSSFLDNIGANRTIA